MSASPAPSIKVPEIPVRGSLVLECGPVENGMMKKGVLVGWRHYVMFRGGKCRGKVIRCERGAAFDFEKMGCKFFAAGTWEHETIPAVQPPGVFNPAGIRADVAAEIFKGGAS